MKYRYLFFDLDGTLTQSEFGIINSILYALHEMGIEEEDREAVKRFIGPPLVLSFKEFYGMTEEDAHKAAALYRKKYREGDMYNSPLYEGIKETLHTLHDSGFRLYVVTAKPTVFAEKIVEHFNLMQYFEEVIGPSLEEKHQSKKELIERAMNSSVDEGAEMNRSEYIMIGDRYYDIRGAVENNIDSIGILYGYGSREELEKEGATYFAEIPRDICEIVEAEPIAK